MNIKKINYDFRNKLHLSNMDGITLCGREYTEKPDGKRMVVKVEEFKSIDEINCHHCIKIYENLLTPKIDKTNIGVFGIGTCIICGNEFNKIRKYHKFCSYQCRKKYENNPHLIEEKRNCLNCGKEFTTRLKFKIYCSANCNNSNFMRKTRLNVNKNIPEEKKLRLEKVFNLKNQGKSYEEIGKIFGVSRQRVQQLLVEYSIINQTK